jgi:hypothetical protein
MHKHSLAGITPNWRACLGFSDLPASQTRDARCQPLTPTARKFAPFGAAVCRKTSLAGRGHQAGVRTLAGRVFYKSRSASDDTLLRCIIFPGRESGAGHQEPPTFPTGAAALVPIADTQAGNGSGSMKIQRRQFLHLASGAVVLPTVSRIAMAQTYPNPTRPVRLIVPGAPGGTVDIVGRLIGQGLSRSGSSNPSLSTIGREPATISAPRPPCVRRPMAIRCF